MKALEVWSPELQKLGWNYRIGSHQHIGMLHEVTDINEITQGEWIV